MNICTEWCQHITTREADYIYYEKCLKFSKLSGIRKNIRIINSIVKLIGVYLFWVFRHSVVRAAFSRTVFRISYSRCRRFSLSECCLLWLLRRLRKIIVITRNKSKKLVTPIIVSRNRNCKIISFLAWTLNNSVIISGKKKL